MNNNDISGQLFQPKVTDNIGSPAPLLYFNLPKIVSSFYFLRKKELPFHFDDIIDGPNQYGSTRVNKGQQGSTRTRCMVSVISYCRKVVYIYLLSKQGILFTGGIFVKLRS